VTLPADSTTLPLFPRDALHPAALAWADARRRDDAVPWCVAFSGGADSLALLLTLRAHFPAKKIVALHFNHHLRGTASDADEKFCRDTCATLGVELKIGHWTHPTPSEVSAREARHAFFASKMSALNSPALFLGHQRDDIAETQLMRLARGSSTAGLAAPRPVHTRADGRTFLRPLLTLTKSEITAALRARGLTWREDTTNTSAPDDPAGDYFRNRIRRDVLPAWLAAAENDALAGAALTRELLEEDAAALDTWLDELLPASAITPASIDLRPLANKPRALLRRALRRWPPATELARAGFESLLAICESPAGGQTSIGDDTAIFENGILRIQPASPSSSAFPSFRVSVIPPFSLALPNGAWLSAELVTLTDTLRTRILAGEFSPFNTIFIAAQPPQTPLIVRTAQAGDRYQPLGASGSAKLSDLFINRKIPLTRRSTLPVICTTGDKSEILWVPSLPPAEAFKITQKTSLALRLTYQDGTCTVPS